MVINEYRLMYNEYKGDGWILYKQCETLVEILKALGVLQACHPSWHTKIETRTITDWEVMEV